MVFLLMTKTAQSKLSDPAHTGNTVVKGDRGAHPSIVDQSYFVDDSDRQQPDADERRRFEEEERRQEGLALRRAAAELAQRRAERESETLRNLAQVGGEDSFQLITESLDSPWAEIRNAAVRALYDLNPDLANSFFNRALRDGGPDRRRRIGAALAGSGLAGAAINSLTGDSHQNTYGAFSFLFLVAKAGEVEPLMRVIETHPSIELRLAVIKLLALSGEPGIAPAFRRLARRNLAPAEVRLAVMDAIYDIDSSPELKGSLYADGVE